MTPSKPRTQKSITRKTEYGSFIRRTTRIGKTRRQKTVRIQKNEEKIVLGKIGDMEIYAYPLSYPNKVFFGIYPMSTYIEEHQIGDIFRIHNKIRWYFKKYWTRKKHYTKGAELARHSVVRAYNAGLNKLKERTARHDSLN